MLRTGVVVVRLLAAGFGVVELDRQGGVGDRNRQGLPGVDSAEGVFCPQTTMTPVAEARRCTRTGSDGGRGGGPAGGRRAAWLPGRG